MNENEIEKIKKDIYRYKTLYEITLNENRMLKEKCFSLENRVNELQTKPEEPQKKSIIYRVLRKIYHIVKGE